MDLCSQILLSLVLVSAVTDVYLGKVYDWVTLPSIAAGLLLNAAMPAGLGAASAVGGLALGFGVLYFLFLTGKMGGGDVKLMGAVGALGGLAFAYVVLVYSFLVGGLLSLLVLIWTPRKGASPPATEGAAPGAGEAVVSPRSGPAIPFGAAISFASLWALAERLTGRTVLDWLV